MDLHEIRTTIDHIDQKLLRLLDQRMEFALRARKRKDHVSDPAREQQVLKNVSKPASALLDSGFLANVFRSIMVESKRLQEQNLQLVGFQGEHGAWGELAVRRLGPEMVPIPCLEFGDVFSGVAGHDLDCGIVPVENSLEGAVTEVNDMLVDTDLKIVAEVVIPIHQNLLALPGCDYREIKVVYSHPQALGQCRAFLLRNKLEPRPFYDTAGAARWLAHERQNSAGVIASSLAAELYGLEIIKERIEDNTENFTRFLLLSREPRPEPGNKCTVVFSTQHRAGALFEVLRIFAENTINLTRIESRPIRKNPGAYAFLLDFLGNEHDPAVRKTLERMKEATASFKILGFYQEAQP